VARVEIVSRYVMHALYISMVQYMNYGSQTFTCVHLGFVLIGLKQNTTQHKVSSAI